MEEFKKRISKANLEALKFVKEEAEKNLDQMIIVDNDLSTKSFNIFILLSSMFAFFCGYTITSILNESNNFTKLSAISLLMAIGLIYPIILSFLNLNTRLYSISGTNPEKLLDEKLIEEIGHHKMLKNRVFYLQVSINRTSKSYQSKIDRYKKIYFYLALTTIVSIIVSLLLLSL